MIFSIYLVEDMMFGSIYSSKRFPIDSSYTFDDMSDSTEHFINFSFPW